MHPSARRNIHKFIGDLIERRYSMEYEAEYTPTEPQTDVVYMLDGRGKMVKVEVDDDASDD